MCSAIRSRWSIFPPPPTRSRIVSTLKIERYGLPGPGIPARAGGGDSTRSIYSNSDRIDLGRLLKQHFPDPNGVLARWAEGFVTSRPMRTLDLLKTMNAALKPHIVYGERHAPGTQAPAETLETKTGACRDFAMVLIEAARYLGFGARFVSGYLYDPDARQRRRDAAGRRHARLGRDLSARCRLDRIRPDRRADRDETLIRAAVTRDPSQAVPIAGSYTGARKISSAWRSR